MQRAPNNLRWIDGVGLALLCFLGLFLAWPLGRLFGRALRWRGFHEVITDDRILAVAWFSLWQALVSVAAVLVIGLPCAATFAHFEFRGRGLILAVASAPFTLPTVVVGSAFLALAPDRYRHTAGLIICAHIFFNLGYTMRSLVAAWERIDPTVQEAAATLGAPPTRVFMSVTLPALRTAITETAAVVFALCFTSFGVVLILGGARRSTVDVEIYRQALDFGRFDRSSILAIGQLLFLGTVLIAARRNAAPPVTGAQRTASRRVHRCKDRVAVTITTLLVLGVTVSPLIELIRRSLIGLHGLTLDHYRSLAHVTRGSGLVGTPLQAVTVSLRSAVIVMTLTILLSTLIATTLARSERAVIQRLLRIAVTIPLATSPVTLGLGVIIGFSKAPLAWRTSWFMIPVVQSVVCLPFVLAIVVPAFASSPARTREAAATLGGSPWRTWWSVDLPTLRRSLAVATGTAFAVGLGEFGAASLLTRPAGETLPVAIARLASRPGAALVGQSYALAVILAVLTGVATVASIARAR